MSDTLPTITINGEKLPPDAITYELSRLVRFYADHMPEDQVRAQLPALREQAISQAIGAKLLFLEAEKLDIQVPDADVDRSVFAMAKQCGGMEKLRAQLKKQNLTEKTLRGQIRRGRRVDILVERICSQTPEPTEEEVRQHFEDHKDEYTKQERVLCQHILVTPKDGSEAAHQAAKDKLSEIRARVIAGADFGDEATAHSDCPSGKNGGSLGWFSHGMMVPEFDKAAFEMKVGDVSDIVKTQFGYHLIYKTDHEAPQEASFEEAHDSVRDFLRHAKRGETLAAHVNELRAKADVRVE